MRFVKVIRVHAVIYNNIIQSLGIYMEHQSQLGEQTANLCT